jgi:signal peptidase I
MKNIDNKLSKKDRTINNSQRILMSFFFYKCRQNLEKEIFGNYDKLYLRKLTIRGESMLPWFRDGDIAHLVEDTDNIYRGDIIVFFKKNMLVMHRVVKIVHNSLNIKQIITKGDNMLMFDDGYIDFNSVIGCVYLITRREKIIYSRTSIRQNLISKAITKSSYALGFFASMFQKQKLIIKVLKVFKKLLFFIYGLAK